MVKWVLKIKSKKMLKSLPFIPVLDSKHGSVGSNPPHLNINKSSVKYDEIIKIN